MTFLFDEEKVSMVNSREELRFTANEKDPVEIQKYQELNVNDDIDKTECKLHAEYTKKKRKLIKYYRYVSRSR